MIPNSWATVDGGEQLMAAAEGRRLFARGPRPAKLAGKERGARGQRL